MQNIWGKHRHWKVLAPWKKDFWVQNAERLATWKLKFRPLCFQGTAIGKCPKDRLFREYIGLELQVSRIKTAVLLTFYVGHHFGQV